MSLRDRSVFWTYLKILLTSLYTEKLLRQEKKEEQIFGYRISFFHYASFVAMFEDMFIEQVYFFQTSRKTPFIVDCGTNIGLELFYYKRLYPHCSIIAFEPDLKTYRVLMKNIQINNLQSVTAYNFGLSDRKGIKVFYDNPRDPGSLLMSFHPRPELSRAKRVLTRQLSQSVTCQVDFLKMDIEGEEMNVLRDLERTKKLKKIKMMIVEYHHHLNRHMIGSFLVLLEQNGFDYQMKTLLRTPFEKTKRQDILVFAYR